MMRVEEAKNAYVNSVNHRRLALLSAHWPTGVCNTMGMQPSEFVTSLYAQEGQS